MFEPISEATNLRLLRYHSLLIAVHWKAFTLNHFRAISDACEAIVGEHGQVSSVVFMQGQFSLMVDGDTRREGAALTAKWESTTTGQALVLPTTGFRASIARSVLTGVNLIARSNTPQKIFQDPGEAFSWVTGLEGQPAEVREAAPRMWVELSPVLERLDADHQEV